MSKLVQELSDADFEKEVIQSPIPVLAPIVEQLAEEFVGKLKVFKVNVDQNRDSTTRYHVRGIPTLILFKNGERHDQIVGVHAKQELANAIKKLLG